MTTSRNKRLHDWTDAELAESIQAAVPHVVYSTQDLLDEQERRRQASTQNLLKWATVAAAIAAVASAAAALLSLLRT